MQDRSSFKEYCVNAYRRNPTISSCLYFINSTIETVCHDLRIPRRKLMTDLELVEILEHLLNKEDPRDRQLLQYVARYRQNYL